MSDFAENLLTAHGSLDTNAVAGICKKLHESTEDRRETMNHLIKIIFEPDLRRAETALNLMTITGMAQEQDCYREIVSAAEKLFTPPFLCRLTTERIQSIKKSNKRFPAELRFTRSMIRALAKIEDLRAADIIKSIQAQTRGTALEQYIIKWSN